MANVAIAPSILAADFSKLGEEIDAVTRAGADYIHVDVMDGHFVPNISIGPGVLASIKKASPLPFDVHLMISPVDLYIDEFVKAGADILTVHPEAGPHIHRTLQMIRDRGVKAGLALNPGTPASIIEPVIGDIDLVLVMSVNPGFGGQKFITSQLDKIRAVKTIIERHQADVLIEVDGGVSSETAGAVINAGADILVAGSAVFKGDPDHYSDNIKAIKSAG